MKLYYMPGACSIGIHVLLEEIGKPYDLHKVDGAKQEQYGPEFVALNPKSKVPTLVRDGGDVLTEFPAIAVWLARKNPEAGRCRPDADGEARAPEAVDYAVSTMHMQGFSRMFSPGNFAYTEADHDKVKARARDHGEGPRRHGQGARGARNTSPASSRWPMPRSSTPWAAGRMKMPLPKNVAAHYERMKARPAVKRVLEQEGLGRGLISRTPGPSRRSGAVRSRCFEGTSLRPVLS